MFVINIAKDFSDMPYGRYSRDSEDSGERFRKEFLVPALQRHEKVIVQMDGALGYGSSFLDEVFAGLVRDEGYSKKDVLERVVIDSSLESIKKSIIKYVKSV